MADFHRHGSIKRYMTIEAAIARLGAATNTRIVATALLGCKRPITADGVRELVSGKILRQSVCPTLNELRRLGMATPAKDPATGTVTWELRKKVGAPDKAIIKRKPGRRRESIASRLARASDMAKALAAEIESLRADMRPADAILAFIDAGRSKARGR